MASFHKSLCVFFCLYSTLLCVSEALNLTVGGRDGWTLHPSEAYDHWSGRLRFNVNDTLHFKYNGGSDSVMEVSKGDYDICNTTNPISTLTGGDSSFNLNRSGPFYFISGNKSNCDQGQKLIVLVLAPRKAQTPPTLAAAPASFSPPVGASGGTAASSPTGTPWEVTAPAPSGSTVAKPAVSAILIWSLAMMMFGFGLVY